MAKVKDENKLQIQLKIDRLKDREIFDILNVADNKSDFIKDALFYFIYQIESGNVINRNYPYNKVNIKLDIVEDKKHVPNVSIQKEIEPIVSEDIQEELYDDFDDDNFDDIDI